MYKITILMSTFNGDKYLREQLNSIQTQTVFKHVKIIVRDDGSTDNTINILKEYSKNINLEYYTGENLGSIKSFHELLENAKGSDFYAFSDQDDIWLPKKLERAITFLRKSKRPMLYASAKKIVDENLNDMIIEDRTPVLGFLNTMLKSNVVSGCTMVFNDFLLREYLKCELEDVNIYHDSYLWKLANAVGTTYFDKKSYILYRQHGNNTVGMLPNGRKLFFQRLKKFIFTNEYQCNNNLSLIAKKWSEVYINNISNDKLSILKLLGDVRENFHVRIKLIMKSGLGYKPIYEYVGIKIRIILGWI